MEGYKRFIVLSFFLREFEHMTSASDYNSLLSDQDTNWFFGVGRD